MGTLADIQTRVMSETVRDDLADDLAAQFQNIIAASIEQYAAERWWFNESRQIVYTTAGVNSVPLPTGARWIDGLYLEQNNGNTRWRVTPRSIDEWERLMQPATQGQPTDYLLTGLQVFLFPTPNQVYWLAFDLISDVSPPLVNPTDSNFWSNQGQDLIVAQSKIRLYRDYLSAIASDPRLTLAVSQEADAYSRLRAESSRRMATGRLQPAW